MFGSPRESASHLVKLAKSKTRSDLTRAAEVSNLKSFRGWELRDVAQASWALTELKQPFSLDLALDRFLKLSARSRREISAKGVDWAQMSVAVAAAAEHGRAVEFFRRLADWAESNASGLSPVDILVLSSSLCHFASRL